MKATVDIVQWLINVRVNVSKSLSAFSSSSHESMGLEKARMGLEKPPTDFQLNLISKYHITPPTYKKYRENYSLSWSRA